MRNFGRAVRLALRYRWTFTGSIICALMVGVLWGGNIGTLYPFVEVVFENRSLQDWVDDEIAKSTEKIGDLDSQIAQLDKEPETQQASQKRSKLASSLESEKHALARVQWIRPYIYDYLPNDAFKTLVVIVGLLVVGTTLKGVFVFFHIVLISRLTQLTAFELRKLLYRRTLRMEMASFGEKNSAELMSHFTYDVEGLVAGLKALFGKAVREPLKAIACLVGAAMICWQLLVLSLVVAPLAGYFIARIAKLLKRAHRRAMEEMSLIYNTLEETFQGVKIVKAFTMERHERRRFHHNNKNYFRRAMKIVRYDALSRPVSESMGITTISLALLAGAYLVLKGETQLFGIPMTERPLSLASLLLFYGLLAGVSDPARKLGETFSRIQRGAAAADRVFSLIDREPEIRNPKDPKPLPRHRKHLEFQQISFSYGSGDQVLNDVNLQIAFGETIGFVGSNGCGKTTLASLIPRFYDPTEGTVRLDGIDLRDVHLHQLRRQIGLVSQETLLFDDTVFNNIRYGSPHASHDAVLDAARCAHADQFITERLAEGYDTVVGQRGNQLSGGQRQRIALARAILRDPSILILDEATSQVDLESEHLIQNVLEKFTRNRTTILITHRVPILALADRIVVMDEGRILDIGTHDELLRRSAVYQRLNEIHLRDIA